jgi:hypothetical protein
MNIAKLKVASLVAASTLSLGLPAFAGDCHHVAGRDVETVVDTFVTANDPFGRVVSSADGTINAVGTAVLTSVAPGAGGPPEWTATTRHVFVVNPQDQLALDGAARFTPIPGDFTDANDTVILTVNGAASLGKFAGATGTITLKGIGFNFYGPFPLPSAAAGSAYFVFRYEGDICLADSE